MRSIRGAVSRVADAATPDTNLLRMRFRISLDVLVTLGITAFAVGVAVGYQLLRWFGPRRAGDS